MDIQSWLRGSWLVTKSKLWLRKLTILSILKSLSNRIKRLTKWELWITNISRVVIKRLKLIRRNFIIRNFTNKKFNKILIERVFLIKRFTYGSYREL